jgi:hypothetical protein
MRLITRALAALAAAALLTTAACGTTTADPGPAGSAAATTGPVITVSTVNGSGCPDNTGAASSIPGGGGIQVTYPAAMTAKAGTGVPAAQGRRECQLNATLTWAGHTWTVDGAAHHGTVDVPAAGSGLQRTSYYLGGTSATTPVNHAATPAQSGPWDVTDPVTPGGAPLATAPCGSSATLNVKADVRVTSTGAPASLRLETSIINVTWAVCP